MTFTEAAVEVLRLVGKPLHYKKITEVAIERNLLSHVGKTPEVTMSSRLATMVKRDRGEAPLIKVKPGVFGLREFSEEQLADLSGDIDELPEVEVENEENKPEPRAEGTPEAPAAQAAPEPRKPLPGADVFPEEEDDDEPILGGDEEEEEEGETEAGERGEAGAASDSRSSRRRRKRRRRGRGEGDEEPSYDASAREPREAEAREPRELRGRERERDFRELRRHERRDGRRERDERRDRDERREEFPIDMSREPGDGDLLGKDLADAVASVLSQAGPRGLAVYRVADLLVRRGRLAGDPNALVPTVMAAVRADVARKKIERARPRFRIEGQNLVLTDFLLPQDVTRAEVEVLRAAERQRDRARRAYLRCLGELSGAGLAEIIATWLNAEGVVGLRAVRRPGSGPGELHLAGTLRRGVEEVRIAVVVFREARELGRERVIEARGALHYYGNASTAWLITFGQVMSGAKEESAAPASAPVTLFDGLALASAMERVGVGLSVQYVPVSALDMELIETLRGPREHDRGRQERERDRGRERGERERPRLELAPRPAPVEEEEAEAESFEEEEVDEELGAEESDEAASAASELAAAPEAGAAEGVEVREGGRRRRRRRRRKGGRDREAQAGAAADAAELPQGEAGGEPWEAEEGDEAALDRDSELDAEREEVSARYGDDDSDADDVEEASGGDEDAPRWDEEVPAEGADDDEVDEDEPDSDEDEDEESYDRDDER